MSERARNRAHQRSHSYNGCIEQRRVGGDREEQSLLEQQVELRPAPGRAHVHRALDERAATPGRDRQAVSAVEKRIEEIVLGSLAEPPSVPDLSSLRLADVPTSPLEQPPRSALARLFGVRADQIDVLIHPQSGEGSAAPGGLEDGVHRVDQLGAPAVIDRQVD